MIRGFFDPTVASPWPRVRVAVLLPGLSTGPVVVEFLLDTGAARTCLHPLDSLRAGVSAIQLASPWLWPRSTVATGVGGPMRYYLATGQIGFWHRDRQQWQMMQLEIQVAPLRAETQSLPSLLGWDVLQHFRLVLEWSNRTVELQ